MADLRGTLRAHGADAAMSFIVIIWGLHFIVMKDGMEDIAPNSYNALRFLAGVPVMLAVAYTQRVALRLSWRDAGLVVAISIIGRSAADRFCLRAGPHHIHNTALLVATTPAWTALFGLFAGIVLVRWRLLAASRSRWWAWPWSCWRALRTDSRSPKMT